MAPGRPASKNTPRSAFWEQVLETLESHFSAGTLLHLLEILAKCLLTENAPFSSDLYTLLLEIQRSWRVWFERASLMVAPDWSSADCRRPVQDSKLVFV